MAKKRTSVITPVPIKKIQTRNSTHLRKLSAQEIKENHQAHKVSEKLKNSQKEPVMNEIKQKTPISNQDIDIYFASCISRTISNRHEPNQENEKISQNFSFFLNSNSVQMQEVKEEFIDQNVKLPEESFQEIPQRSSQNSQYGNQSPIFGRKISKNDVSIPSCKLDELKIYDHSQELEGKQLIDQLQQNSKVSFLSEKQSFSHQESSRDSVKRFGNRIDKKKQKTKTSKKTTPSTFLTLNETEIKSQSKNHHEAVSQVKRRAEMLRLSCLTKSKKTYENSLQVLKKTSNFLKSVMYYYEVREYQEKVYSFRSNVFQVLNDEIRKLRNSLVLKREVCCEAIQKKTKCDGHSMWENDYEKKSIF